MPATRPLDGLQVALDEGRELVVTALCVDLRDSTRLAAGRLPFDAVFIVDRYVQAVTASILARGGHITSVAGDGIMSMFGVDGDAAAGAQRAIAAMAEVWAAMTKSARSFRARSDRRCGSGSACIAEFRWSELWACRRQRRSSSSAIPAMSQRGSKA